MVIAPPEIGELIASTNGSLGYVIECNQGIFHVEWMQDPCTEWYYNSIIEEFRENYEYYYGLPARR